MVAKIAEKFPAEAQFVVGKTYAWCACGHSSKQPFCDGTHKKIGDIVPLMIKAEKAEQVWLCQCKQTKNPPYCDGTHRTL